MKLIILIPAALGTILLTPIPRVAASPSPGAPDFKVTKIKLTPDNDIHAHKQKEFEVGQNFYIWAFVKGTDLLGRVSHRHSTTVKIVAQPPFKAPSAAPRDQG